MDFIPRTNWYQLRIEDLKSKASFQGAKAGGGVGQSIPPPNNAFSLAAKGQTPDYLSLGQGVGAVGHGINWLTSKTQPLTNKFAGINMNPAWQEPTLAQVANQMGGNISGVNRERIISSLAKTPEKEASELNEYIWQMGTWGAGDLAIPVAAGVKALGGAKAVGKGILASEVGKVGKGVESGITNAINEIKQLNGKFPAKVEELVMDIDPKLVDAQKFTRMRNAFDNWKGMPGRGIAGVERDKAWGELVSSLDDLGQAPPAVPPQGARVPPTTATPPTGNVVPPNTPIPNIPITPNMPTPPVSPVAAGQAGVKPKPQFVQDFVNQFNKFDEGITTQKTLTSTEKGARVKEAARIKEEVMLATGDPDAAYRASTAALKGEYSSALVDAQIFTPEKGKELAKYAYEWAGDKPYFVGLDLNKGIQRVFASGKAPTESQVTLFRQAFGDDFTQAIIKATADSSKWKKFLDIANIPKSFLSNFDLSFPLRQGIILSFRDPKAGIQMWKDMFKAAGSDAGAEAVAQQYKALPHYQEMLELGMPDLPVGMAKTAGLYSGRAEEFASAYVTKFLNKLHINFGERAFVSAGNSIRFNVGEHLFKAMDAANLRTPGSILPTTKQTIVKMIADASGRGSFGSLNRYATVANTLVFSPRYVISRLRLPSYLFSKDPFVRKEAWKMFGSYAGGVTGLLSIGELSGAWHVGLDPRSADFGKVVVGKTRYDLGAGFLQWIRFTAQMGAGGKVSTTTGEFYPVKRTDLAIQMGQTKGSPLFGIIWDMLEGEDYAGNPMFPNGEDTLSDIAKTQLVQRLVALSIQDAMEAVNEYGPMGGAYAAPGVFGAGIQTYGNTQATGAANNARRKELWLEQPTKKVASDADKAKRRKELGLD